MRSGKAGYLELHGAAEGTMEAMLNWYRSSPVHRAAGRPAGSPGTGGQGPVYWTMPAGSHAW